MNSRYKLHAQPGTSSTPITTASFVSKYKINNTKTANTYNPTSAPYPGNFRMLPQHYAKTDNKYSYVSDKNHWPKRGPSIAPVNGQFNQSIANKIVNKYVKYRPQFSTKSWNSNARRSHYVNPAVKRGRFALMNNFVEQSHSRPKKANKYKLNNTGAPNCSTIYKNTKVTTPVGPFRKGRRLSSCNRYKITNPGSSHKKLCPYFTRYGKCKLGQSCILFHDPTKVAICTRFLRLQACDNKMCTLSHEYSLDKMPLCQFFLKGCCGRVNCPYLHVKHRQGATVCLKFKTGYCPNGAKCHMLHTERNLGSLVYRRRRSTCLRRPSAFLQKLKTRRSSLLELKEKSKCPDNVVQRESSKVLYTSDPLPSFIKLPSLLLEKPVTAFPKQEEVSEECSFLPSFLNV